VKIWQAEMSALLHSRRDCPILIAELTLPSRHDLALAMLRSDLGEEPSDRRAVPNWRTPENIPSMHSCSCITRPQAAPSR
jgi:hypothetical protein